MKYREFGNTGIKISTLGFGCMRFPGIEENGKYIIEQDKVNEMIKKAFEMGVNYFDTAYYYCRGNSEIALGIAVKDFRNKIYLSTKCPIHECNSRSDFRKFLNESLRKLNTSYIDFYHFWALNKDKFDNKVLKYNLLEEAMQCKKEGLIRHISFSFHDEPEIIKYIIDEAKIMETMLVQYNLLDRKNEEMISYAKEKGLGVVIMGPVAGGRLAHPSEFTKKLTDGEISTHELALKFVLSNNDVSCALSGMENLNDVLKNIKSVNEFVGLTNIEQNQINERLETLKKLQNLYCTECNYCQPCPKNIKIPKIFLAYTYKEVYGLDEAAKKLYKSYLESEDGQVENCIECKMCENKCPQKIKIIEDLKKIHKSFI